jgi:hypothetical protein
MKPISYEKEIDTIALLKKQISSREVVAIVGLSQSKMNRIRKKYFKNIVIPRKGRPQALTTWEKSYAMRLVIVGGLYSAVQATGKLKSASKG